MTEPQSPSQSQLGPQPAPGPVPEYHPQYAPSPLPSYDSASAVASGSGSTRRPPLNDPRQAAQDWRSRGGEYPGHPMTPAAHALAYPSPADTNPPTPAAAHPAPPRKRKREGDDFLGAVAVPGTPGQLPTPTDNAEARPRKRSKPHNLFVYHPVSDLIVASAAGNTIPCPECGDMLKTQATLATHIKRMHKREWSALQPRQVAYCSVQRRHANSVVSRRTTWRPTWRTATAMSGHSMLPTRRLPVPSLQAPVSTAWVLGLLHQWAHAR